MSREPGAAAGGLVQSSGRLSTCLASLAVTLAAVAALAPSAAAVNQSSTFASSAEGWRNGLMRLQGAITPADSTFTHESSLVTAEFDSTRGNPPGAINGYLGSADPNPSPPSSYYFKTFVSPTTWAGNWSANYGGMLRFDLTTTYDYGSDPTGVWQVEIVQGTTRLVARPEPMPSNSGWTSYGVPLHQFWWVQCTNLNCTGVSRETFEAMLANTSADKTIRIFATMTGDKPSDFEMGTLDNVSLTEDSTAPDTQIVSGPGGPTSDNTPTFSFRSTGEPTSSYGDGDHYVRFECSFDQGTPAYESCGGVRPVGDDGTDTPPLPLADGEYTFRVRATDLAGNVDGAPATQSFRVDTRDPAVTIDQRPRARISTRKRKISVRFTFSADEAATFRCKLDAKPPADCTSPKTYRVGAGKHIFTVTAEDAAGNSASASDSFRVVRKR